MKVKISVRIFDFLSILLKYFIIFLVKFWKLIPHPPSCRFYPSCSEYALECVKKYKFPISLVKIAKRLIMCNPFSKGGVDLP
jgi:putative membrane protein insertion efficiency factor